jgi:lipopolysaccharide/colanic/teichoic acid biosynthesis glycosyltransferase
LPLESRFASERSSRRVLLIGDIVAVCAAFPLAPFLFPSGDFQVSLQADPVASSASLALAALSALIAMHLTRLNLGYSWFERIQQIALSVGTVFVLEAVLNYTGAGLQLELTETFSGSLLCAVLLAVWYLAFRLIYREFPPRPRVLLLGADPAFAEIGGWLTARSGGFQMLGPFPFPGDLPSMAEELTPHEIVVGDVASPGAFPANALLDLRFRGVTIFDAAAFCEEVLQRISCRHLEPIRFLYGDMAPKRQNMALQAIYSNLLGLAGLVMASPVLLIAAIALKLSAPSEPLMEPNRAVGLYGIPFDRLRFQSKSALGQWLAKMRVRDLPQLFNVVRGEMSLVGPRPSRVEFNEELCREIPYYSQRVAVRPGLTGWAQIHPTGSDAAVELEYDLYYIKHVSPSFDFDILIASMLGQMAD